MYLQVIGIFCAGLVASFAGVRSFCKWSLRRNILDHPNERSSHSAPTPRGGGIVIVAIALTAYLTFSIFVPSGFSWGYFAGSIIIAAISWLDDLYSVPLGWRLVIHFLASGLLVANLGYFADFGLPNAFGTIHLGPVGAALTSIWLVWMINAYNFMDGIDGMAAAQGLIAALGWAVLGWFFGASLLLVYSAALAGACLGFLLLNWQPAKVFMGDVGSAFLGFTFAAFPLLAIRETPQVTTIAFFVGLLFLWFLFFDTIVTLLRRMLGKRRFWQPHREHFYQRLVIKGWSHAGVSGLYAAAAVVVTLELIGIVLLGVGTPAALILSVFALSLCISLLAKGKKGLT